LERYATFFGKSLTSKFRHGKVDADRFRLRKNGMMQCLDEKCQMRGEKIYGCATLQGYIRKCSV